MSTPQYCPGCGNRCSLDSPSCSTGEAYLRALRQAKKKQRTSQAASPAQDRQAPATVPPISQPEKPAAPTGPAQDTFSPRAVSRAPARGSQVNRTTGKSTGTSPGTSDARPRADASGTSKKAPGSRPTSPAPEESYGSLSRGDKLAFQLHSLSRRMAQNQPREKAGQSRILALLAQRGELTQRQLVALAGIRSSSLSELLGKLERAGLIQRSPCPTDRRTTLVALTEQGRQQATQSQAAGNTDPFQALSSQEQQQLLSLLEKLNQSQR